MMNRRDFIRSSALGAAAFAAGGNLTGSLFANPYGKPIGLQLYTLRDELEKDVPGTLKKMAAIGYKEAETYDLYGMPPAKFAKVLKDNGLTAPSGHYVVKDIKTHWEESIAEAKALGLKYMVNAILLPEERKSFDDFKRLVTSSTRPPSRRRRPAYSSATITTILSSGSTARPHPMSTS